MKRPFFKIIDLHFVKRYLCMAVVLHFALLIPSIIGNLTQQQEDVKELFEKYELLEALKIYFQYHILIVMSYLIKLQPCITTCTLMAVFCVMDKNITTSSNRCGPLIPLLAAGMPRYRIAVPFFIATISFNLFMCMAEEIFYANCQNWPGADSKKFVDVSNTKIKTNIPQYDDVTTIMLYGNNVDLENGTFENGKFILSGELTRALPDVLEAGSVQWLRLDMEKENDVPNDVPNDVQNDHSNEVSNDVQNDDEKKIETAEERKTLPNGNKAVGYILRNIKDLRSKTWLEKASEYEFELKFPNENRKMPIFYTHKTLSWLEEGEIFLISTIPPRNLIDLTKKHIPRSLVAISRELSTSSQSKPQHSLYSLFHFRIMRPIQETALLFCVIPIILSGRITHKFNIAAALFVCLLFYYAVEMIGNSLIDHYGFSPAVGAWFPTAAISLAAAVLYHELYT